MYLAPSVMTILDDRCRFKVKVISPEA